MSIAEKLQDKLGRPKVLLTLFILLIAGLFLLSGNIIGEGKIKTITGGVGILDLKINYSPQYVYEVFALQGELGRELYRNMIIKVDLIFPLIDALFFLSALMLIFKPIITNSRKLTLLIIPPILIFIFDISENLMVLKMLSSYPKELHTIAILANMFTMLKFVAIAASILLAIRGLFLRYKQKQSSNS